MYILSHTIKITSTHTCTNREKGEKENERIKNNVFEGKIIKWQHKEKEGGEVIYWLPSNRMNTQIMHATNEIKTLYHSHTQVYIHVHIYIYMYMYMHKGLLIIQ